MPAAAPRSWVLDTSALFCLKEDEPGAQAVENILRDHGGAGRVFVSFMSLMEYCYVLHQERGEAAARRGYLELRQLPLQVIESDEELGLAAARIKGKTRLSVADAWIAATAQRLGAALVHKDPEFEPLKEILTLHPLPYKSR
ncbi:MAG TPA: type II toxin-antitoxin system VapC family toxin [Elusimicrobiota bacterium]|nr:type II toxin-antitoxin system VapC family toxin [Elusimicrobiota bacterium]